MRRLLDERIEIRRENAIDLMGSYETAEYLVSKTGSTLGDRIIDILSAMPGLWIHRFEGLGIFRRIAIRRQQRSLPEKGIDPVDPDWISRIDLPL